MGESTSPRAKLRFDRRVRLEFRGATLTSDAGLLACRELDDALGLTETADECLQESRGGRNVQHRLVGLLRQSVYSRLAGYEDTNDAERLADDPTMRVVVGRRGGPEGPAASTNTMSRFETEVLSRGILNCELPGVRLRFRQVVSISTTQTIGRLVLPSRRRRHCMYHLRQGKWFANPRHPVGAKILSATSCEGLESHQYPDQD